jgi:hypothetical protein
MSANTSHHFLSSLSKSLFAVVSAEAVKLTGIVVLVGSLLADIAVILWVPSGPTEKTLSAICTAGIILGIILEEFGVHEISRLEKSPRREIIAGKEARITNALKSFSGISFDTGIGPNDKDVEDFLWTWSRAFGLQDGHKSIGHGPTVANLAFDAEPHAVPPSRRTKRAQMSPCRYIPVVRRCWALRLIGWLPQSKASVSPQKSSRSTSTTAIPMRYTS